MGKRDSIGCQDRQRLAMLAGGLKEGKKVGREGEGEGERASEGYRKPTAPTLVSAEASASSPPVSMKGL